MAAKSFVLITGASSGIGYASALAFAGRGKNLILVARTGSKMENLKLEIARIDSSLDIVVKECDLSIIQNCYDLFNALEAYHIECWINNAGFGIYDSVANQKLDVVAKMFRVNIEALTVFSTLYVRKYQNVDGAQLINVSSGGGYQLVPNCTTYCATKFYVSAFTEGLAYELIRAGAKLRAKVLAPALTKTGFGSASSYGDAYDYSGKTYHTPEQVAGYMLEVYNNVKPLGIVSRDTMQFTARDTFFIHAINPSSKKQ
ncbi:MAG: SDR family NAD(P)-dependent oxidoreductase [Planctomycetota bacterium]|nr:SDR family NAD(P)-dependent oxidoreductase [Planctomycetota bacterium]